MCLPSLNYWNKAPSLFSAMVFTLLRAKPLAEATQTDLVALGLRINAMHHLHLPPRENPVVAFVKHGHTSKEIARELFVTDKAIGCHLTRIFSNTGVRNRRSCVV